MATDAGTVCVDAGATAYWAVEEWRRPARGFEMTLSARASSALGVPVRFELVAPRHSDVIAIAPARFSAKRHESACRQAHLLGVRRGKFQNVSPTRLKAG